MSKLLLLILVLTLTGCCHTPGFEDSQLCYILRGEPENYPGGGGSRTETIRIYDGVTGEALREYKIRRY
ncbi:MAG: hypothetical protein M0R74_16470 [Dehalococcoidia bacterium]|jgi:hypothetical protein|nr:hypothetical protein [Dehalococcoidia bacterium]